MAKLRTLSRRRSLAILAVGAAITGGSVLAGVELSTASAAALHVQQSISTNWAGYVVQGKKFSSVSGSWVVPSAKSSSEGYSAVWVGLGGSSNKSSALEQIGTESDYAGGQTRYYAWYELLPSSPVTLKVSIQPGDHIAAKASVSGTRVTVSLSDLTTGKSVTKTLHMSHPDTSSADWITEAPAVGTGNSSYRVLSLADFGKVNFNNASATAGGHTGSIADSHWTAQKVQLVSTSGGFHGPASGFAGPGASAPVSAGSSGDATTSSLGSHGSSFSVAWGSSSTTVGQSAFGSPGAGAGGYGPGGFGPAPRDFAPPPTAGGF
jgi:hypothetical protein